MTKKQFNALAAHPLQAWEWGEFRTKTGVKVIRFVEAKHTYQITFHPIPKLPYTIGYLPKSDPPTAGALKKIRQIGREQKAIFIKLEPNLNFPADQTANKQTKAKQSLLRHCQPGKNHFHRYTFQIDLAKSEDEILAAMKSKTRYNIRLAERRGVKIIQDKSKKAFEIYLRLMWKTTQRQGFYAHTKKYHRLLWETLKDTDIYHLFLAQYQGQILAAYVFFIFNRVLYYPYGASTREHREVMAPHALFWQAIKFGKSKGCRIFDMWGSLGPDAKPTDPWSGFHRFKAGFGGRLMESIGAYDLVINSQLYPLYRLANRFRWALLRLRR